MNERDMTAESSSNSTVTSDIGEDTELDVQVKTFIEELTRKGLPEWHAMDLDRARRVEDDVFSADEPTPITTVRDRSIPGSDGELPIRVYRPDVTTPAPVCVFYHGGGWVLGTLDSADGICREVADRTECVVVSVDYRLAPEHPFPAATDDAWTALNWVARNASRLGGDPERLCVAGTSAGGNLAAVTALHAREQSRRSDSASPERSRAHDGPTIGHQLLLYPITNYGFDTDSYEEHAECELLTKADMEWFWEQYLPNPTDGHDYRASPLRAENLSNLPPTTVVTGGFDPLRDEGIAYADRLDDAGVTVCHQHYPSLTHGFLSLTDTVDVADHAMDRVAGTVRSSLC